MRAVVFAALLTMPVILSGCTVGPDFHAPPPPAASTYLAPAELPAAAAPWPTMTIGEGPQARWWVAFGSPDLDALVDRALANNQSLRASDATLAAAQDELRAVAGRRLPQIDANARIEQQQLNLASFGFSGSGFGTTGNPDFHLYSVGGGISYDLDLFGGLRRQVEQSAARAEAQARQTEAAHLVLAGQVVGRVLEIAAIRANIAVAQAVLDDDQRNLDLTRKRRKGGDGTLTEELNAQAQYTSDRASLPALDQRLAEARHGLAILIGIAPADLGATEFDIERLKLPANVPVSLPSQLVHRRPDILQSEAELHAATAAIGIATAQLYPDITLGASISQAGPAIGDLVRNAFRGYDLFGGLTAPVFHGGTLRAQRAAAIDRARAADAAYQQTVLTAFGQVADLLSALATDARAVAMQGDAVAVAERSLHLSRRSFEVGNSGVLQVLDSERLYQRARADLVNARARQIVNVARLYVATANGWVTPAAQGSTQAASR